MTQTVGYALTLLLLVISIYIGVSVGSYERLLYGAILFVMPLVYVFSAMKSKSETLSTEIYGALTFTLVVVAGLALSSWFLVVGIFLHGVWDFKIRHVGVWKWYPSGCLIYDWLFSVFVGYRVAIGMI